MAEHRCHLWDGLAGGEIQELSAGSVALCLLHRRRLVGQVPECGGGELPVCNHGGFDDLGEFIVYVDRYGAPQA